MYTSYGGIYLAKKQEYGNESIKSLKGADRVRKRPAVILDQMESTVVSTLF